MFGSTLNPSIVSDDLVDGIVSKKKKKYEPVAPETLRHEEDLAKEIGKFLLHEKFENTTFITFQVGKDKEPIKVYKNIIESRCKILEKHKKLPNVKPEIFNIFIEFLYSGTCSFSVSNIEELLNFCDDLKLKDFKKDIFDSLNSVDVQDIINLNIKNEELSKKCEEWKKKPKIPDAPSMEYPKSKVKGTIEVPTHDINDFLFDAPIINDVGFFPLEQDDYYDYDDDYDDEDDWE
eukprot:gene9197-1283_t